MIKSEGWKCQPGSIDALNLMYDISLNEQGIPIIKNQEVSIPNRLIMYKNYKRCEPSDALHFFIDDYRFEHLWNSPSRYLQRLSNKILLAPDFSLYSDYPEPVLRWNVYRSRWLGAYWQTQSFPVIPTVSWGDESTYDYCFDGIEQGATVAVSGRGAGDVKKAFTAGMDEMIEQIQPETILCYGSFRRYYGGKKMIQNVIVYDNANKFGQYDTPKASIHQPLIQEVF